MTMIDAKPHAASDTKKPTIFVDGASGTTGLGIQERRASRATSR